MVSEWQTVEFYDVLLNGTRNGIYKSKEFHGSGTKIVNMGELFANPRLFDIPMKRVELSGTELEKSSLRPGDLLFARRSLVAEGAGKCTIVMEINEPTTFESSIIRARPNLEKTNSLFLYYLFNSPQGHYLLGTILRQVAVSGITGSDLVKLRIPLPPLPEQRAIAAILGALDDKIELNRRMNATLEAIARALFKSWFVDFDPVRAKLALSKGEGAAGEQPPGLAPHIADLFPDAFVDSELGEIPRGWEVSTLGQIIEIHDSKRIPLSSRERSKRQGIYPYYGAAGIIDYVDDYLFDGIYVLIGEDGSVITDQGNPVVQYVWGKFWVNNHAHVLTGAMGVSNEHLMLLLKQIYLLPYVTGAVQPKLNQTNMKAIPIVRAPVVINEVFGQFIATLFSKSRLLYEQNMTLAALRDTLLPQLISGELRVPEKMIQDFQD